MAERERETPPETIEDIKKIKESWFKLFLAKLRKRKIIETLAAFIGGGWLVLEFVDRILVAHYLLPGKTIDITFITLLCALICTLIWRWLSGHEAPRKFKLELVIVPLVVLITILLDINLVLHLKKGPKAETFPATKWKNSIAVLPFVDMSPQKDQEYFCDGMTEDLISRLSNIRELKVPARTSAFMFKGKTPDMRDVGEKLKVQTVLEGSIQKSGNQLRITAQLINIADGYHLWSEKYDRELKDIFAIQDEIASAIVAALRLKLTSQEKTNIAKHPIYNIAAYVCYLKARNEIYRFSEDGLNRALQYLQEGIQLMGDNALLYSGMAWVYFEYFNIGVRQEEFLIKSEEYTKKALALDPDCPESYVRLAWCYLSKQYPENLRGFIRNCKLALTLDPNHAEAIGQLADIHILLGKSSAALPLLDRLKQIEPGTYNYFMGWMYFFDGKYGLAIERLQKHWQREPENAWNRFLYVWTLACNKQTEKAISVIDQYTDVNSKNGAVKYGLLLKYGLQKDKEKAFQVMTPDFQKFCRRDYFGSFYVAAILALLDAKNEALDWLENAAHRGFINYPLLAEKDPSLASIRGEERFKKLMERVKYEWEHFED